MVFHHREDPDLGFAVVFTLVKEGRQGAGAAGGPRSSRTFPTTLSRQSTTSVNSLTSSIASLTSTFSKTFTNSSTTTNISAPSPSLTSSPFTQGKLPTGGRVNETAGVAAATRAIPAVTGKTQPPKQYFHVHFISGPESLKLGFEADLAPYLSSATGATTTRPIYSYKFDLPDPNLSLSVKIRKAPKVSNAGGKNYNALLGVEYRRNKNTALPEIL